MNFPALLRCAAPLIALGSLLFGVSGCAHPAVNGIPPVVRFQARPMYPPEMRLQGASGEVDVGFIVDDQGIPRELTVVKSTRWEFEGAALKAVSLWRFNPGMVDGKPVFTRMQAPLIFNVADQAASPTPDTSHEK